MFFQDTMPFWENRVSEKGFMKVYDEGAGKDSGDTFVFDELKVLGMPEPHGKMRG